MYPVNPALNVSPHRRYTRLGGRLKVTTTSTGKLKLTLLRGDEILAFGFASRPANLPVAEFQRRCEQNLWGPSTELKPELVELTR